MLFCASILTTVKLLACYLDTLCEKITINNGRKDDYLESFVMIESE